MKILVVEDDKISLKLVVSILEKNQYEVVTAGSGKEAVSLLEKDRYIDIIVSDVMMPAMNGLNLLKHLKADMRLKNIPVLLCTALSDEQSVKTALKLGVAGYITKPVDANILLVKIKEIEKSIPRAVLVVDDEELLRNLLYKMLNRAGYKVLLADSAAQALQLLEERKVATVISDIRMPEMNGPELLATIKQKFPQIPVLLMTGYSGQYDKDKAIAAGAEGFITKPFKSSEILAKVKALFSRSPAPAGTPC